MANTLNIFSYNRTGLGATSVEFVKLLMTFSVSILLIQETWHLDNYTGHMRNINDNFLCYPVSGVDEKEEILRGRPYGGTAFYYSKTIAEFVAPIPTGNKRFSAISLKMKSSVMLIVNVYLPCDNYSMICVDSIEIFILMHAPNVKHILVAGDFNVDPGRNNAHFNYLNAMMERTNLISSWHHGNARKDYTFTSNDGTGKSCIDHMYCSMELYQSIQSVSVLTHALNPSNHDPVTSNFKMDVNTSSNSSSNSSFKPRPAWHKAPAEDMSMFSFSINEELHRLRIPDELMCRDINCKSETHKNCINEYTENVINTILNVSDSTIPYTSKPKTLPGWNEYAKPLREKAIFWHNLWKDNGKPDSGIITDIMRSTRKKYHKQVKELKRNQRQYRYNRLAEAVVNGNGRDLWTEIKKMDGTQSTANTMDGKSAPHEIAQLFSDKYKSIYNSVGYDEQQMNHIINTVTNLIVNQNEDDCTHCVTVEEVSNAIKKMNINKHDGNHGVYTNHLKYAPKILHEHLSNVLSAMLTHGYTPYELCIATLVSIPKDLKDSITSSNNYRGIALGSILCKVYDIIIINRYSEILSSSDLQFAYKDNHSTTACTNLVRETAHHYITRGGCVYTCLLDASKAFDRVSFVKLFNILLERKLPPVIIRSLIDMYRNQQMRASWNGTLSDIFSVTNGTKQGAILSCTLFCVYLDHLLIELKESGYGCRIGIHFLGALGYADDVTLASPTFSGLQHMVTTCESYGQDFSMQFNEKKTVCMKISRSGTQPVDKHIVLNGKPLKWVCKAKHLGNWLSSTNTDLDDIKAKTGHFIGTCNKIQAKFPALPFIVKQKLFQSYCTSYYGCQSWCLTSSNKEHLYIAWRKAIRKLFDLPWMAHCVILPCILAQDSAEVSVEKRMCRYVFNGANSSNDLVSSVFTHGIRESKGIIGENVKYLKEKYAIPEEAFIHDLNGMFKRINSQNKADYYTQRAADQVIELLTCNVPLFNSNEISCIIGDLCTQ